MVKSSGDSLDSTKSSHKMDPLDELVDKIVKNDLNGVQEIISRNDFKVDTTDAHGMTPLQHASYKGSKEIVGLLIDQGADVNSGNHEHGYTALHFAALSGSTEVCQLLLEHGAKSHAVNSVGRTASQMAAFVGNHACVTVINNFVPKSDIDYYTVPSGFETEPKLPPLASAPLHKFVMQINLNPVRVAINLMKSPILCENIDKVRYVLELMSEREMKRGIETNEIMSFKFHYLSCIVAEIIKCRKSLEKQQSTSEDGVKNKKITDSIELFIKKMLKINKGSSPEYQECFLRQIVKEFPCRECTIFRQMVTTLSRDDSPGALSVITGIVNGQRGFADSDASTCAACGEEKVDKKCSQCKTVQYCNRECQRFHWFMHKKNCANAKNNEKPEAESNQKLREEEVNSVTQSLLSELKDLKAS